MTHLHKLYLLLTFIFITPTLIAMQTEPLELYQGFSRRHGSIMEGHLLDEAKKWIAAGNDVNIIDPETGYTSLLALAQHDYLRVCEYLLHHGADITRQTPDGKNAFDVVFHHSSRLPHAFKILAVHAQLTPCITRQQLALSRRKTLYALWVFKQVCPGAPKEIKKRLLMTAPIFWQDVMNTPLKMHYEQYDQVPFTPLTTLRTLIEHQRLELSKTAAVLKNAKIVKLSEIFSSLYKRLAGANPYYQDLDLVSTLCDQENLEAAYGQAITDHLHQCLSGTWDPEYLEAELIPDNVVVCPMQ